MPKNQITGGEELYLQREKKRVRYEDIAHQINREDNLTNNRLKWILQLNGFLFASLALMFNTNLFTYPKPNVINTGIFACSNPSNDLTTNFALFLKIAIPSIGFFVSFGGLIGVIAAQKQIKYLTSIYEKQYKNVNEDDPDWVRPFGKNWVHFCGCASSWIPPLVLMICWLILFCIIGCPIDINLICLKHF